MKETKSLEWYEQAIAGGWKPDVTKMAGLYHQDTFELVGIEGLEWALEQDDAWIAVGKTRGWKGNHYQYFKTMYQDYIGDGMTLEEAIAALYQ